MRIVVQVVVLLIIVAGVGQPVVAAELPQDHAYQRVLRDHMATLKEADFDHGIDSPRIATPEDVADPEARYRNLMLAQMIPPMIGSKRGTPSVNTPPRFFTLKEIEGGDQVILPLIDADSLMSFAHWSYPGNPLHNSRALKHRAFVRAAVQMMMADQYHDANSTHGRSDWHAYQLIYFGFPYARFKDILPLDVQAAYVTGMERYARRILGWGVKGEEPNMDVIAAASLWYAYDASKDQALRDDIKAHVKMIFTNPKYFHPAGYWVERGGLDIGFAGMANYFANWAALKSNRDYANEAVARIYRLRAHLILNEPDGDQVGPTHFNSRIGSDPHGDQWAWEDARDYAASMITDEAAHLVHPTTEQLAQAAIERAGGFNSQLSENPRVNGVYLKDDEIRPAPWRFRMWYNWNFPVTLNPAYDHYREGAWAHRQALEKSNSPMLKSPFERGKHFIRNFADAFVVANQPGYRAILHVGPVGRPDRDSAKHQFSGPMGFGGGQLSAFATDASGAVILGRRGGQNWDKSFDRLDAWRTWPLHAVSGVTNEGKVFTSARIADPDVTTDLTATGGVVKVGGDLVAIKVMMDPNAADPAKARELCYDDSLSGSIAYARSFTLDQNAVSVTTSVTGDGKDTIAELYETIPVFHRRDHRKDGPVTTIAFEVGGKWVEGTDQPTKGVTAIRLSRFDGAVEVRFKRARTVRLSPEEWRDNFLSRAAARAVLVDLLEADGKPVTLSGKKQVTYTVKLAGK